VYPIAFEADPEIERRNRLTTLLRGIVVIPWAVVSFFWLLGAQILAVAAWFAILITGRYPPAMYEFNARAVRMLARVNGFCYLLTDRFPSFDGDPDPAYPVRVETAPPKHGYDRVKTGLRLIIGIPVILLGYVQAVIGSVCSLLGWFAILFAGRFPEGLYRATRAAVAYQTRAVAYFLLLTEDYPPFDLEPAAERGGA
jgi:Domain of unknown function (DUF4389)